jgi:hypothetical protein
MGVLLVKDRGDGNSALVPGGHHFVGFWTLRVGLELGDFGGEEVFVGFAAANEAA